MADQPSRGYLRPYQEALAAHGPGFHATLWSSEEGQRRRFDVIIDLAGLEGTVIVDVGCGVGDLAARLIERQVAFARYVGLDALPELIAAGQRRAMPRCEFHVADVLTDAGALGQFKADCLCFSGTLNTMEEGTAQSLVARAFASARLGVVFNFLSDRCPPSCGERDLGPAKRFDTVRWLDWALSLSPLVKFRQDYLDGHDATIFIQRCVGPD
jgi:SAM-dependent methyltransferase